jgi:transcriptional activator SPT7
MSLDVYPELKFPTYGLNPIIDRNNRTLEKIRLMYAKCNAIRNNVPVKYMLHHPLIQN